ncbi:DMT family transporter [Paracoccus benzoatiresistens]|uniref:DMT family transporter n=1 Tax=Paracoccus benzoatiresistens TaxID=2997341 RepID=A0ABT4IZY1_9RHOB|nr:DMT family transporter [Paracoccus sp. EF6]MCZ0960420.1 DMT family transporter [Paracoccus sp. EF6]
MPNDQNSQPYAAPAPPAAAPRSFGGRTDRTGLAIALMCATSFIFAMQDAFSRMLGSEYPPVLVVMLRYWFFALFVIAMVSRQPGGLRRAIRTRRPKTQILRGAILVLETTLMVEAFVRLGLVGTHAIFTAYPLLIAALSGPILGERVGWRRWTAIGVGFVGIVIILQPGSAVLNLGSVLAFASALLFALYGLLTRHVARDDPAQVSFFWTGIAGAATVTVLGIGQWEWLAPADWIWMGLLCVCGLVSHYLLIRAYELAEASALQPFAYTQLVWVSLIGVMVFGEALHMNVVLGTAIVVAAGLFTLWRARVKGT